MACPSSMASERKPPELTPSTTFDNISVDTGGIYSITLHRRLSPAVEVGFDVSHFSRRSNRSDRRNYRGLLTGVTSTYAF